MVFVSTMDIEKHLDSADSQDSRLKILSADLESFKRNYSGKHLNGESTSQDIADIAAVVQTIKAVSAACSASETDEPDKKKVKLNCITECDIANGETDRDKTQNGIGISPSDEEHSQKLDLKPDTDEIETADTGTKEHISERSNITEELPSPISQNTSHDGGCDNNGDAENPRFKNELSPVKGDVHQDGDLNETVKRPVDDYLTPVKSQPCSSDEPRKSPFLIVDKMRNSLKGIVEKAKSSPDHKKLSISRDEKEDRTPDSIDSSETTVNTKHSPEMDRSVEDDKMETDSEKDDVESASKNIAICDRDNETPCIIPEKTLVQSDNIVANKVLDQNNHIPVDSVRLKESEAQIINTVDRNSDEHVLLQGVEDDTLMDISSDKETELLQEHTSESDLNNESVVFLGNESVSVNDNSTDLISKCSTSGINDNSALSGNQDNDVGNKRTAQDVIESNSADSSSLHSDSNSFSEKVTNTKQTNENNILFEGENNPEPKVVKESKEDISSPVILQISETKQSNSENNANDQLNNDQTAREKECSSPSKENLSTDSDISLIEDDSITCENKNSAVNQINGTSSNEANKPVTSLLNESDECDITSGEKNVDKSMETNSDGLKSIVDSVTVEEEDDDDDVIFECVVKSSVPKTDEAMSIPKTDDVVEKEPELQECKTKSDNTETELKDKSISQPINESVSSVVEQPSEQNMSIEEGDNIIDDDDDDVIFEGEDKPGCEKLQLTRNNSNISSNSSSDKATKEIIEAVEDDSKHKLSHSSAFENAESKDTDDKKDDLCSESDDNKSKEEKLDEIVESTSSVTSVKNSLKRPADVNCEQDSNPKRTRLDEVIGKLGSQIGVEPESIEVSESEDDDSTTDTALEEKSEDTQDTCTSDNDDDETSSLSEKVKYIKITEQELDELVETKVKAHLFTHRDTVLAEMMKKLLELQVSNDLWKSKAKELCAKVAEVTVLQTKHDKRKAATAALKQITTRNVAVQVDEGKTSNASKSAPQTLTPLPKTPPRKLVPLNPVPLVTAPPGSNGTIRLPIPQSSIAPPVLTAQMPQLPLAAAPVSTANYKVPTVKSLLDNTRQQITSGSLTKTSNSASTSTTSQVVVYPNRMVAVNKMSVAQAQSSPQVLVQSVSAQAQSIAPATQMTSPIGTTTLKVIDLTMDESDNRQQPKVVALPAAQMQTLNQLRPALSSPQPQQFLVNQNGQLVQAAPAGAMPGQTFQLVFNSSAQPVRTATVPVYTSGPQTGTILQNLAQRPVTSLTTAAAGPQAVPGQVPGPMVVRPPSTSSQISSLLSQTKSKEVSQPSKPPMVSFVPNIIDEQIRPALRKKLAEVSSPPPQPSALVAVHPAPLPITTNPTIVAAKLLPPKPSLKISRVSQGIVLSWNMTVNETHAEISSYQLFAYQESTTPPSSSLWKKVGDVKALPLPMACTLTQFQVGNKYHFSVRAVDGHNRVGPFSDYSSIHLTPLVVPIKP